MVFVSETKNLKIREYVLAKYEDFLIFQFLGSGK